MEFTDLQLTTLSRDYAFYCCTDGDGNKETGRYVARLRSQLPRSTTNGTYVFTAIVPILHQPDSPVHSGELTNVAIDSMLAVTGNKAAATVAKTHPALIRALLV